jgi:hypothetical protein
MVLQFLAGVACLLAALLQFAVHRSPDCRDTRLRRMARRIVIASLIIAGLVVLSGTFFGVAPYTLPAVVHMILGLFGLSQIIFAYSDLLPHLEEHPKWTSRLTSSR